MANNKPSAKFKAGAVSVALWPTEITVNGRTMTVLKASLDKRYKDNATCEWKSSSSLSRNEVGQAVLCLGVCPSNTNSLLGQCFEGTFGVQKVGFRTRKYPLVRGKVITRTDS